VPARPRQVINSLGRICAMLLLPLSIAPVLLLGPSVLRAPMALGHEAWGEVQRLELALQPARAHAPVQHSQLGPSSWRAAASLGAVYGRWSAFPQVGATGITWTGAR
jgi:hypothetical protein